jgi:hypothetical protein
MATHPSPGPQNHGSDMRENAATRDRLHHYYLTKKQVLDRLRKLIGYFYVFCYPFLYDS